MAINAPLPRPARDQQISRPKTVSNALVLISDRPQPRTSFSSVNESLAGSSQTFTQSRTSSYFRRLARPDGTDDDHAIDDASPPATPLTESAPAVRPPERMISLTNPHSTLHGFMCPCDGFRGWKHIAVGGKIASKSSSDLAGLGARWEWEQPTAREPEKPKRIKGRYPPGRSPLEKLPVELLSVIIGLLAQDIPPNGFTARNIDLMSLLLASRAMHGATLATLYNNVTIPHSRIFRKFLLHVKDHPALGTIVRRLDFSHFNPTGAGQSAKERAQTLNLIPATLLECLSLTPNLREFLAQEHVDDDLDLAVLQKLFCGLPMLKAVDLCACSSTSFRDAFTDLMTVSPPLVPNVLPITRLSLHECTILPSAIFSTLLPRLPHLTHLDVAHTRINTEALFSIPRTAGLTHLNLSKCSSLSGPLIVQFLATHPAAQSLVYLNLASDARSHEMLDSSDITAVLSILPPSLRSLSLKGSSMDSSHIQQLLPLTKHLEELGLGRHVVIRDVVRLFVPDEHDALEVQLSWIPHSLSYLDVSDLSPADFDLGVLFSSSCPVLKTHSAPLQVLELAPEVYAKLRKSPALATRAGWCLKEAGRRYWLVRDPDSARNNSLRESLKDSGARDWKWGACSWGMRKLPVARQDVGGMYGHYMFKR